MLLLNICANLYSTCSTCISHYADRQCGWNFTSSQCTSYPNGTVGPGVAFGPDCSCSNPSMTPSPPTPTPVTPPPVVFPDECASYSSCDTCTLHYADRQCGWCQDSSPRCIRYNETAPTCNYSAFYYDNNAKCNATIPPPDPTPWPRYDANPSFCYSMTDSWCKKCVSTNKSLSCGWCHSTNECIMGDREGPFFGSCANWMIEDDDKCLGKLSPNQILGIRIGLSVALVVLVGICVFGCYKVIKRPSHHAEYESLETHE
jgi:hypothetical protein